MVMGLPTYLMPKRWPMSEIYIGCGCRHGVEKRAGGAVVAGRTLIPVEDPRSGLY